MKKEVKNRVRLGTLDILTGGAMLLVISGHHRFLEEYAWWYGTYGEIVYSFHMALFMLISGFLIQYSYPSTPTSYTQYVGRKLRKFLPAYFTVGLIASVIKSPSLIDFFRSILLLFYDPVNGSIQIIWYIYVLMVFYALMPFITKLSKFGLFTLLPITLVLSLVSSNLSSIFCLRFLLFFLFFFLVGVLSCRYFQYVKKIGLVNWFILGLPFLTYVSLFIYWQCNPFTFFGWRTISSILALPFCVWIGLGLHRLKYKFIEQGFSILSKYAFSIYLWQMFAINTLWLFFSRLFIRWLNPSTTFIYLIISTCFTVVGIIVMVISYEKIKQWLVQRIKSKYY